MDQVLKQEIKKCPRCGLDFECKSGSITQCQCSQVNLTKATAVLIKEQFADCLCIHCLKALQAQKLLKS